MLHPLIKFHGETTPLPEKVHLRAGHLTMIYEAGFLRHISCGTVEIVRVINHYIRDENWNNIPMTIIREDIERHDRSFSVDYTAQCIRGEILFEWNCYIDGREDSTVTFNIEGKALHPFKRNRLGFTVLHPIDTCAGKACIVTHSDHTTKGHQFPERISPHQPFIDITAMEWSPEHGLFAYLHFDGDIFEIEDQRNWMDASYKTYCTPLSKPFPHQVNTGDVVKQEVKLSVAGCDAVHRDSHEPVSFIVDHATTFTFPKIGIPESDLTHTPEIFHAIKALNADFIRVAVHVNDVQAAAKIQKALGFDLPLQLVLFFDNDVNPDFTAVLLPFKDHLKEVIVLPSYANSTDQRLLDIVVPVLRKHFPGASIGGGTDSFFTELNRQRTPHSLLDFLSFAGTPQAHAPDITTMVENHAAHRDVVSSSHAFSQGHEVHIGPLTFKIRKNPAATKQAVKLLPGEMPPGVDARHLSLFGAGWTLGSIKYFTESEVPVLTYYETCGWKGIVSHPDQPWPDEYGVKKGSVYPLYLIFKMLLAHKHQRVARFISDDPLKMEGMAFVGGQGDTIFLANYTGEVLRVRLPDEYKNRNGWMLTAENVESFMADPSAPRTGEHALTDVVELPGFGILVVGDYEL